MRVQLTLHNIKPNLYHNKQTSSDSKMNIKHSLLCVFMLLCAACLASADGSAAFGKGNSWKITAKDKQDAKLKSKALAEIIEVSGTSLTLNCEHCETVVYAWSLALPRLLGRTRSDLLLAPTWVLDQVDQASMRPTDYCTKPASVTKWHVACIHLFAKKRHWVDHCMLHHPAVDRSA